MKAHTQGPWGIERTRDTNWIGPLRVSGKCASIVAFTDREGLTKEALRRSDANAAVISAAASYYDAMEMAESDASDLHGDDAGYVAIPSNAWRRLKAAHRKAKGRV